MELLKDFELMSFMVTIKFNNIDGYFVENNWWGDKFDRRNTGFQKLLQ